MKNSKDKKPIEAKQKKPRKKIEPRTKIIILALLSFLLTAGILYLMMAMPKKAEEIKKIRTQSLAYQISGQDEVLLVKSLKETEAERARLNLSFPTEVTLLDFIKMAEGLKSDEVEILKLSLDSDVPTKIGRGNSFLPVTLMLSGEENKVDEALSKIINSQYFIKTISFAKEYDSKSVQVIATIQFHLYVADEFN